jgi:hypothetical protein
LTIVSEVNDNFSLRVSNIYYYRVISANYHSFWQSIEYLCRIDKLLVYINEIQEMKGKAFSFRTTYFIICFVLLVSSAQDAVAPSNLLTYENSTFGIKFQHPANWKKIEPKPSKLHTINEIVTLHLPKVGDEFPHVDIFVENLPTGNIAIKDYARKQYNMLRQSASFRPLTDNATTIAGFPALEIESIYGNSRDLIIFTIKANKAYTISFIADPVSYSKYLQDVQKMISSFEIKQ